MDRTGSGFTYLTTKFLRIIEYKIKECTFVESQIRKLITINCLRKSLIKLKWNRIGKIMVRFKRGNKFKMSRRM